MTIAETASVDAVEVHRLRVPLKTPYRLSYGVIECFDALLAVVSVAGRRHAGESVPLPGYAHERCSDAWDHIRDRAARLTGGSVLDGLLLLEQDRARMPFATSALLSAIESALQDPDRQRPSWVPLVAGVERASGGALRDAVESVLQNGHRVVKVKVGWDPDDDARWVTEVQEVIAGRARLRIDANQAYSLPSAVSFAQSIDESGVEVFEQPVSATDWDAMVALAGSTALPIMLDEAIDSEAALGRAVELGGFAAVKFKLAKAGGLRALSALIDQAHAGGLQVVVGNGVATEVSNYQELVVAGDRVETAGEMNGFLRQRESLLLEPLEMRAGGALVPAAPPELDLEKVASWSIARERFDGPGAHGH
ncbi:MAG TPA: enolase C-terminal domain-like protein [Solirubrobacteraceae bacterium]